MILLYRLIDYWAAMNLILLKLAKWLIIAMVFLMTVVIALQVIFRYVLNDALSWSEEVARYMMVWMTFLGIPIASYKLSHPQLTMILDALKGKWRNLLAIALQLLSAVVLVYGVRYSWAYAQSGLHVSASSVPVSRFISYVAVPIGFLLTLSVTSELIAKGTLATFSRSATRHFGALDAQVRARARRRDL